MSSHSSHHRVTTSHPYPYQVSEPQCSTSTLASTGETKKTFLGRWKSVFKKEAMEVLLEHDSPLSSFPPMTPPIRQMPPAIPPIQHNPLLPLTQQTWQGTSYDSAWETQAHEGLPLQSSQASIILGVQGYEIHQPTLLLSSTFSGTTSTSPTLPFSHDEPIPTKHGPHPPMLPSYTGISPYRSPSSLPPHQPESCRQSSSPNSLQ